MTWVEWVALIVASSTVYVYVAFMALCTARRMLAEAKRYGFTLPWEMWILCGVLYVIGAPADVAYNWTVGTWRFRFRGSWKITYSQRIQWHVDQLEVSRNPRAAIRWAILLNAGDPEHIKRLPTLEVMRAILRGESVRAVFQR